MADNSLLVRILQLTAMYLDDNQPPDRAAKIRTLLKIATFIGCVLLMIVAYCIVNLLLCILPFVFDGALKTTLLVVSSGIQLTTLVLAQIFKLLLALTLLLWELFQTLLMCTVYAAVCLLILKVSSRLFPALPFAGHMSAIMSYESNNENPQRIIVHLEDSPTSP